jgi:pyridoxamine 5'-phosphate oxidase
MNQKNSLGLNSCFLDLKDPIQLFKMWMEEAKKAELNDPNALSLATADKNGTPSVRIVLLKDFSEDGFVFYTNLESKKSRTLKENPKAEMCFHWKSLLRQIRVSGSISKIKDEDADQYYNTRSYNSKIGAWASKQSSVLKNREQLMESIKKYRQKYDSKENVPRPPHWSGWNLLPTSIEFWLNIDNRIHERLLYTKSQGKEWNKSLLSP